MQAPGEGDTTPAALRQQGLTQRDATQRNADSAGVLGRLLPDFLSHVLLSLKLFLVFQPLSFCSRNTRSTLWMFKDPFPLSS